ncbi:hypothetical protein IWW50_005459, partial [Coemansia erecta]
MSVGCRCRASTVSRNFQHRLLSTTRAQHQNADEFCAAIRDFKTTSSPSAPETQPASISALRARVQSSPWVQQIASGVRQDAFSATFTARDLLIRVKGKQLQAQRKRTMLAVDELESFSGIVGKSRYMPLSARGVLAFATDLTLERVHRDIGWIRPDIVEHCARVLRLRALSTMHRAHSVYSAHASAPPCALHIPERGYMLTTHMDRLQAIREEVRGRIQRQDAQWAGPSIFTMLPPPSSAGPASGSAPMEWQIGSTLPPAGLQCILEIPVPKRQAGQMLSTTSETDARSIWASLLHAPVDFNILDQHRQWNAQSMAGPPEPHTLPALSIDALERLYHLLPRLTPESMKVPDKATLRSKSKKRKQKIQRAQLLESAQECAGWVRPVLGAPAQIRYAYLESCSGEDATAAGTKIVPVYDACSLFGDDVCSTVLPWLLGLPVELQNTDAVEVVKTYVGLVALPCTADLATQLY